MDYIYCAGEQGRVVADILDESDHDRHVAFIDDDESRWGDTVSDLDVVGGVAELSSADPTSDRYIVAYGGRDLSRKSLASPIADLGFELFSAIHPDVTISGRTEFGSGVMLNGQTYVGPGVDIGDFVLIDSQVNISHDVALATATTVAPGVTITGGVSVGEAAYLGAGSTITDHVSIGSGATVGAGAVVTDDVSPGETVVGVPARPLDE